MTLLIVTEYLCHKLPRIWSVCRNHNPVLFLFITYHWICSKSKMTGATSGAATAHPSRTRVHGKMYPHYPSTPISLVRKHQIE